MMLFLVVTLRGVIHFTPPSVSWQQNSASKTVFQPTPKKGIIKFARKTRPSKREKHFPCLVNVGIVRFKTRHVQITLGYFILKIILDLFMSPLMYINLEKHQG